MSKEFRDDQLLALLRVVVASQQLPSLALRVVPGGVVTGGLEHQLSFVCKLEYLEIKLKHFSVLYKDIRKLTWHSAVDVHNGTDELVN
jgi:hypothetical protein